MKLDATVVGIHARAVGVEDAHDANVDAVLSLVIHEESFGAAFAFVVARANTDGVNMSPVAFFLRVHQGVPIDFGGGGLQNACLGAPGEAKHVDGTHDRCLHRLDGIVLVVDG